MSPPRFQALQQPPLVFTVRASCHPTRSFRHRKPLAADSSPDRRKKSRPDTRHHRRYAVLTAGLNQRSPLNASAPNVDQCAVPDNPRQNPSMATMASVRASS